MRTTPLGAPTRLALTSLLVTSTLLLAGCGGASDPQADPTPPTTSSSSPSASDDPSESDPPSIAPATGKVVETKDFTARVPRGWQVHIVSKDFVITAYAPEGGDSIAFSIVDTFGKDLSLEVLAQQAVRVGAWTGKDPSIVAETELGGEPAYHLVGSGGGIRVDARGAVHNGDDVSIRFDSHDSDAGLQKTVESVLATWQWK